MLNKLITPTVTMQNLVSNIKFDKESLKSLGKLGLIAAGVFAVIFISLNSLDTRHDSYSKSGKYLSVGGAYEPLPTQLRWKSSF
jgi:hypothetical protein